VGIDAGIPQTSALAAAGEAAAEASDPVADANGSADYKRHLVAVLVGRAVRLAIANGPAGRATT
jgi:carbon-monoxide dehydrogenase medium subunit